MLRNLKNSKAGSENEFPRKSRRLALSGKPEGDSAQCVIAGLPRTSCTCAWHSTLVLCTKCEASKAQVTRNLQRVGDAGIRRHDGTLTAKSLRDCI